MLTESQASKLVGEPTIAVAEAPARQRDSLWGYVLGFAPFLAVVVQFGLLVLIVKEWQLESQSLSRVMQLAFVGFIIHHFLPLRFRLPFFAGLSLVAVITAVGHFGPNVVAGWIHGKNTTNSILYHLVPGLTLIGIGLGFIWICHLSIRF